MTSNRRSVSFVQNPTIGTGLWRYSTETMSRLHEINASVDSLTLDYANSRFQVNSSDVSIPVPRLPIDYKYYWYLRNQSLIPKYKLYHLSNQNLSFLNIHPKIVTVYDLFHLSHPRSVQEYIIGKLLYSGIKDAVHIIAGSEYTKSEIISHFNILSEKITVVYAGVSEDFFKHGAKSVLESIRNKYAIPRDKKILLHVSNEQPHKNFDVVLRAIDHLKNSLHFDDFVLLKVGKPQYKSDRDMHLKMIAQLGIQDHVRFLEYVDNHDLPYIYQLSDVFLFPSAREGFGLPVLESMASGCPVVTGNSTSLPEVVADAGIMVDPTDHKSIADRVYKLFFDREQRNTLISMGYQHASQFRWEQTASDTLNVYNNFLSTYA